MQLPRVIKQNQIPHLPDTILLKQCMRHQNNVPHRLLQNVIDLGQQTESQFLDAICLKQVVNHDTDRLMLP